MTIECRGVSTASLGAMLKGYGVMAGIGAARPDARFWWTPAGALVAELADLDGREATNVLKVICDDIFKLKDWAIERGDAFKRAKDGVLPLREKAKWDSLTPELVVDAEGVGVFSGTTHSPNPVLPSWGQDAKANLFATLSEAGSQAKKTDVGAALYGSEAPAKKRLKKASGVLFPEGIKRYATGTKWIQEPNKSPPLGVWDFILAMRGLLLFRGGTRSPRGSRYVYSAFPFILPGSAVYSQGKTDETQEFFLPTWTVDRPRALAEFQAQIRSFQARAGKRDFASSAADFRKAVTGRAITGAFDAFHRFALEPRKPSRQKPQTQAVTRGKTMVGPASSVRNSLRILLAPLDDSGWLESFRLSRNAGKVEENSVRLAAAKRLFDEAVHAAIDVPGKETHVAVLRTLWDLQVTLWRESERSERVRFRLAPLLKGSAWERALPELFETSSAARLGWALASLGWVRVMDDSGQMKKKPVLEQLLPVTHRSTTSFDIPDPPPKQRVHQRGHMPTRELTTLFWRRWLDTMNLPTLPAGGTRPADVADVVALLHGGVSVKELQRYFLAFLCLDGTGDPPPSASYVTPPASPAYAALRLWLELSARPPQGERRPNDGIVPRGIVTGTPNSVESACRVALRRLRVTGLPGFSPDDGRLPNGKSVAIPEVRVAADQAQLMTVALLTPIRENDVRRIAKTFLVPSASSKTNNF